MLSHFQRPPLNSPAGRGLNPWSPFRVKARQSSVFVEYDQRGLLPASTALVLLLCVIRLPQHLGRDCATVGKETCNQIRNTVDKQSVWASFGHPNPQKLPFKTPKNISKKFLKMSISSMILN